MVETLFTSVMAYFPLALKDEILRKMENSGSGLSGLGKGSHKTGKRIRNKGIKMGFATENKR